MTDKERIAAVTKWLNFSVRCWEIEHKLARENGNGGSQRYFTGKLQTARSILELLKF